MTTYHSPKNLLKTILSTFLEERGESSNNFCFFVPCFGLGDRLAYIAFIPHLKGRRLKLCALAKSGDAFISLYKELFDLVILIDHIELSPWVHGDGFVGPGNIFFMWHKGFVGGIDLETVFTELPGGHKLAVKASLGLDITLKPIKPITNFTRSTKNLVHRKYVFLSPIANSSPGLQTDNLQNIISYILESGIDVVLNSTDNNSVRAIEISNPAVEFFTGDLSGAVEVAQNAVFCINARSGFSEVLSLVGARFIDIYSARSRSLFWSLSDNFFSAPIAEFNAEEFTPELLDCYLRSGPPVSRTSRY